MRYQDPDPQLRPAAAVDVRGDDAGLLGESLALIPDPQLLVADFYSDLFAAHPDVRPLFPYDDEAMAVQRDKLLKALLQLVQHYAAPDQLVPALTAMGIRHVGYGARIEHYAAVGQSLLATLRKHGGEAWTPRLEGAWRRAYTFAAGNMLAAGAGYAQPGEARPTTT